MGITYSWVIENCTHNTDNGFITNASWRCNAQDGQYASTVYGSCGFSGGTPSVPYANVTQQQVLDWCWANGVNKEATEANCAQQIELQKNPVSENGLPWSNT
jgi:hypothetical protein